ncbi:hypothetical protein QJQ45_019352, partial [Haematococcus lacustris]
MSTVSTAVQMSRDASVQMSTVSTAVQMSRDASVQMSFVSTAVQMSRDASVQMSTVSTAVQMSRDASMSTVSAAVQMSRDASVQMSTVSTAVQMSRDASVQMSTVSTAVQMSRDASVQMVLYLKLREQVMTLEQTAALLQPLHGCCWGGISFNDLEDVSSEHVLAMAALCRGCTHLEFYKGSLAPSLEFWHQLGAAHAQLHCRRTADGKKQVVDVEEMDALAMTMPHQLGTEVLVKAGQLALFRGNTVHAGNVGVAGSCCARLYGFGRPNTVVDNTTMNTSELGDLYYGLFQPIQGEGIGPKMADWNRRNMAGQTLWVWCQDPVCQNPLGVQQDPVGQDPVVWCQDPVVPGPCGEDPMGQDPVVWCQDPVVWCQDPVGVRQDPVGPDPVVWCQDPVVPGPY